jgi:hypothetical protein
VTPTEASPPRFSVRTLLDMAFGAVVMGTVGTMVGMIMGGQVRLVGAGVGLALGTVVGLFGGRRFLISILVGTVAGGALAWVLVGAEKITVGAGAGAAMGGFLGVQASMLLDMRAERKRAAAVKESEEENR